MLSNMLNLRRGLMIVGILIVTAAVYGFAASNDVPETGAGDGSNTISGYTITNVSYTLEGGTDTDPSTIEAVAFDLAATDGAGTPATVEAQIVNGGTWYSCSVTTAPSYTCAISPSVNVSAADQLRVVAAE